MESGIYQIISISDGKRYIGSAVDLKGRWRVHRHHLQRGTHHCPHLQHAWNKYGPENFFFSVMELADCASLIEREQFWIDLLSPQYNAAKIAGSLFGTRRTPEQREKMRESQKRAAVTRVIWNKGKNGVFSPEAISKIREARSRQVFPSGWKASESAKLKMSLAKLGTKRSPRTAEHRRNLSKAMTGKRHSPETLRKLSASKRGTKLPPRSAEHSLKLSEALKRAWRRRHEPV